MCSIWLPSFILFNVIVNFAYILSSIWHHDLNPWLFGCKSSPLTTIPWLLVFTSLQISKSFFKIFSLFSSNYFQFIDASDLEMVLSALSKSTYTWDELQQRPLPDGVDPSRLEKYISDDDFKVIRRILMLFLLFKSSQKPKTCHWRTYWNFNYFGKHMYLPCWRFRKIILSALSTK